MPGISEKDWTSALTSILEELENLQYNKLMEFLDKIPRSEKTSRSKVKMPGKILQHYGLEGSISAIRDAMEWIPRRDGAVQDLLRPFVDKLKTKPERTTQGLKRKGGLLEGNVPAAGQQRSCSPGEGSSTRPAESVCGLKSSDQLADKDAFTGKVVGKTELRPYVNQRNVKGCFFEVTVVNETVCRRMMVYGKDHDCEIKEGRSYLFQKLIIDESGVIRVTTASQVSETSPVAVREELEKKARRLLYPESPVCSIAAAKSCADKTEVSVEGAVTQIYPVQPVKVRSKRSKTKRQDFYLKDDTGSIKISMWGVKTKQSEGLSVGDVVTVTNVRTNEYNQDVSLNSTDGTRVHSVQSVGVQVVRIQIKAIVKASMTETQLKAEFKHQLHTLVVSSKLLAKAFGLKLDDGFKDSLVSKLPLSAEAEIQGNTIQKMTPA
ncbi:uncharacterized protein [Pempheris klunzingeri]|uniref:uncharacterized protein n=1 Tax=Pempheris klunzingeri TaxID=3127111 RepID=UPI0039817540